MSLAEQKCDINKKVITQDVACHRAAEQAQAPATQLPAATHTHQPWNKYLFAQQKNGETTPNNEGNGCAE